MTEAVLDASVLLKWFRAEGERNLASARSLRTDFAAGKLVVIAPPLLHLEIVNVAARRWHWDEHMLLELATALVELGVELHEAPLERVARWSAAGLTAYDASYVALAEVQSVQLVTDDDVIVAAAPHIAIALADVEPGEA